VLNNQEKLKSIFQDENITTFWDRATLYALRGVFAAGETKKAMEFFQFYSKRRLLGEHVPYPVEAYPEGNQRHLSAESALYCRVVTEGLFGIRPTGFNSFTFTPKLPESWSFMKLKNIKAFNSNFTISLKRNGNLIDVQILDSNKTVHQSSVKNGVTLTIQLK
jgi:cellobiose phosphorylase